VKSVNDKLKVVKAKKSVDRLSSDICLAVNELNNDKDIDNINTNLLTKTERVSNAIDLNRFR